ncbi:hypothetical protein QBC34DRAFT_97986 [Podospora aff. communis PSN243]|uniref:MICOS complex subunit MIC12 n=1 Tax=Podospora aff. communis PSN243 TaxID=3040156 RepID=A0AAV9GNK8_9PEZI|nr:hypothetical protein QBC34DRAFT_97986 [Podospora aff. communis PSN243]
MGFLTGATGGITLTLGLTYLALATHQRNRQSQSDILRSQTRVLNALSQDSSLPRHAPASEADALYPPSRAELAARERTHFLETAKDRWNAEVEGAVRWVQNKDWTSVREDAEERFLGVARSVDTEDVRRRVHSAEEKVAGVAGQVRADVKGAVAKGIEVGKDVVGRAKAAVYLAEERAEAKVDARLLGVSEIERALNQRYERDDSVMKKSVKEVLAERYKPIGERDNTKLRGI